MTRTSRNGDRKRDRCQTRRVEAANPSLTVGALTLPPKSSATFGTDFMMQALGCEILNVPGMLLLFVALAAGGHVKDQFSDH